MVTATAVGFAPTSSDVSATSPTGTTGTETNATAPSTPTDDRGPEGAEVVDDGVNEVVGAMERVGVKDNVRGLEIPLRTFGTVRD